MTTQHTSRAQWAQIEARVKQAKFRFDPKWKCLIDGLAYSKCREHDEVDQEEIIEIVKQRLAV